MAGWFPNVLRQVVDWAGGHVAEASGSGTREGHHGCVHHPLLSTANYDVGRGKPMHVTDIRLMWLALLFGISRLGVFKRMRMSTFSMYLRVRPCSTHVATATTLPPPPCTTIAVVPAALWLSCDVQVSKWHGDCCKRRDCLDRVPSGARWLSVKLGGGIQLRLLACVRWAFPVPEAIWSGCVVSALRRQRIRVDFTSADRAGRYLRVTPINNETENHATLLCNSHSHCARCVGPGPCRAQGGAGL